MKNFALFSLTFFSLSLEAEIYAEGKHGQASRRTGGFMSSFYSAELDKMSEMELKEFAERLYGVPVEIGFNITEEKTRKRLLKDALKNEAPSLRGTGVKKLVLVKFKPQGSAAGLSYSGELMVNPAQKDLREFLLRESELDLDNDKKIIDELHALAQKKTGIEIGFAVSGTNTKSIIDSLNAFIPRVGDLSKTQIKRIVLSDFNSEMRFGAVNLNPADPEFESYLKELSER